MRKICDTFTQNLPSCLFRHSIESESYKLQPSSTIICQRSFIECLTLTRLNHAMTLLRYTLLPIREIAERSGFHDYKQFSLVFKKFIAQSPTSYRQQRQSLPPNQQTLIQSNNHFTQTHFSEVREIPLNQQVLQQLATAFQLDL